MSAPPTASTSAGPSNQQKSAASNAAALFAPPEFSDDSDGENGAKQVNNNNSQNKSNSGPSSPRRRAGKERADDSAAAAGSNGNDATYIDSDEDSDPDDPVIKTLPVFLTPALADSLALLQYPHRPPVPTTHHPLLPPSLRPDPDASPEDDNRPPSQRVSARYRPRVGQLELSVPLDVGPAREEGRFNDRRADLFGKGSSKNHLGATGTGSLVLDTSSNSLDSPPPFGNQGPAKHQLQRTILAGETLPDQTWYACAVLKDNEVHLTPLTRTMQMRASLSYLDELDTLDRAKARKERAEKTGEGLSDDEAGGGGGGSDVSDTEANKSASAVAARKQKRAAAAEKKSKQDDLKTVNVSVTASDGQIGGTGGSSGAGGVRDAKTARAAASLFGPIKAAQEEIWVDLPFYDPTTPEANHAYGKLFASKRDKLDMITSSTQYLRL